MMVDLTGRKFGRWRVIALDPQRTHDILTKKGHTRTLQYWMCECECGCHKSVEHYSLLCGGTQSCGCLAAEHASASRRSKGADYVGQQFGRWVVVESVGYQPARGGPRAYWLVRCSCAAATEKTTTIDALKRGKSLSCGCLARELASAPERGAAISAARLALFATLSADHPLRYTLKKWSEANPEESLARSKKGGAAVRDQTIERNKRLAGVPHSEEHKAKIRDGVNATNAIPETQERRRKGAAKSAITRGLTDYDHAKVVRELNRDPIYRYNKMLGQVAAFEKPEYRQKRKEIVERVRAAIQERGGKFGFEALRDDPEFEAHRKKRSRDAQRQITATNQLRRAKAALDILAEPEKEE